MKPNATSRTVWWALVFLLLCTASTVFGAELRARNNLALKKPASASSLEFRRVTPECATDGDQLTRWASKFEDPQWLSIDLGEIHRIDKVRLFVEAAALSENTT